jgi:crossover junction endodeoxyribonuclease RuvC
VVQEIHLVRIPLRSELEDGSYHGTCLGRHGSVPPMRVMGVDTSTKTGYVILDDKGDVVKVGVLKYPPHPNRFARYAGYARDVYDLVDAYGVDIVIIEGYSFAGKFNNSMQYELGACIRMRLYQEEVPFVEVPPTSLKKFVTGKGNVKKDLMLLNVYKRWDFDTEDDNEADAYGLAQFGRAIKGYDTGVPAVNLTALEKVLSSLMPAALKLIS